MCVGACLRWCHLKHSGGLSHTTSEAPPPDHSEPETLHQVEMLRLRLVRGVQVAVQ